jgi:hypothetical protein
MQCNRLTSILLILSFCLTANAQDLIYKSSFEFVVAIKDSVEATEPLPATGAFAKNMLMANDRNIDPASFSLISTATPCAGTVSDGGEDVIYTGPSNPTVNCLFTDTFIYEVCGVDATTLCDTATVTININRLPEAVADGLSQIGPTNEDTAKEIGAAELLANDSDPNNDDLTVISVQEPVNGFVDLIGTTITFIPAFNFNGAASFQYTISDGRGGTDNANVTVIVNAVNDAPVLDAAKSPVLADVTEDAPSPVGPVGTLVSQIVELEGLLDNVDDPDGPALGIAVIGSDQTNGSWHYSTLVGDWQPIGNPSQASARTLDGSARLYFEPDNNYNGTADIDFRAWDTSSGTNGGTANTLDNGGATAYSTEFDMAVVTVTPLNDPPTSTNDSITILEDGLAMLAVDDFGNYDDVEGTPLAAVKITTLESDGSLEFDMTGAGGWQDVVENQLITETDISAGRLRFMPNAGGSGSPYATIGFRVSEDQAGILLSILSYTLTVNVDPVNDAPVISDLDGDSFSYAPGSGGVAIDQGAGATITDEDSPDFSGGSLTVTIAENYNDNPTDTLNIINGDAFVVDSNLLKFEGATFAFFDVSEATLTVSFVAASTEALASDVLQHITFENSDGTGLGLTRTVTFVMTDGDGGTSSTASVIISEGP